MRSATTCGPCPTWAGPRGPHHAGGQSQRRGGGQAGRPAGRAGRPRPDCRGGLPGQLRRAPAGPPGQRVRHRTGLPPGQPGHRREPGPDRRGRRHGPVLEERLRPRPGACALEAGHPRSRPSWSPPASRPMLRCSARWPWPPMRPERTSARRPRTAHRPWTTHGSGRHGRGQARLWTARLWTDTALGRRHSRRRAPVTLHHSHPGTLTERLQSCEIAPDSNREPHHGRTARGLPAAPRRHAAATVRQQRHRQHQGEERGDHLQRERRPLDVRLQPVQRVGHPAVQSALVYETLVYDNPLQSGKTTPMLASSWQWGAGNEARSPSPSARASSSATAPRCRPPTWCSPSTCSRSTRPST